MRMGSLRKDVSIRTVVTAVGLVMIAYSASTTVQLPSVVTTVLVVSVTAVLVSLASDSRAMACGAIAALAGTGIEIAGVQSELFSYSSDILFGVAAWLPALYFGFGVTVSVMSEYLMSKIDPPVG